MTAVNWTDVWVPNTSEPICRFHTAGGEDVQLERVDPHGILVTVIDRYGQVSTVPVTKEALPTIGKYFLAVAAAQGVDLKGLPAL